MDSPANQETNELRNQIREVALTCALIDVEILLAELREQVQGHRQRNRILDSQIEHFHQLIGRLEAIAESWEWTVRRVANLSEFDIQLQKLTARILGEAAPAQAGESGHETEKGRQGGREAQGTNTQARGNAPH